MFQPPPHLSQNASESSMGVCQLGRCQLGVWVTCSSPDVPARVFQTHRRPQKMKVHLPKDMKLWPLFHSQ